MKRLAIICGLLMRGGAERITVYLAKYMQNRGIRTIIITGGRTEIEYESPDNVERYVLTETEEGIRIDKKGAIRLHYQIKRLKQILLLQSIDTILVMDVPICIYAIPGAIGTGAKIIVSERNDPAHFSGKKMTKWLSRVLMRKANGFVFQTKDAQKFYGSFVSKKSTVIPNPVSTQNMPEIPYEGRRENKIVSVARLDKQKNLELLIDAFLKILKEYPEYQLYIWGEGPERGNIENYIKKLDIKKSVFLPGMTDDIFGKIYRASVFVLSSDFEGMPNALIEAMALGLPCISTDCSCGGPRELIENGKNGMLIPVNDRKALTNSLRFIIKNESYAEKMGKEAFKIREKLNYKKICSKWYDFLSSY